MKLLLMMSIILMVGLISAGSFGYNYLDEEGGTGGDVNNYFFNTFDQFLNTTDSVEFVNVTADYFFGDGSQLTGISGGIWTNVSGTATYDGNVNITENIQANNIYSSGASDYLTYVGNKAGYINIGNTLTAVGFQAGYNNEGNGSVMMGYNSGVFNTGNLVVTIGHQAGYSNTGAGVVAIGQNAGYQNSASSVMAVGFYSAFQNSGGQSVGMGNYAIYKNTQTGVTGVGYGALSDNTGLHSTGIGYLGGYHNSGNYGTQVGYYSGYYNTGNQLSSLGYRAGLLNSGSYVVAMGYRAGESNTGHYNIGLGYEALKGNTVNSVIALGYRAGLNNAVANQFIVKQDYLNSVPLIQGDFVSGNVGIGTSSSSYPLEINGSVSNISAYFSHKVSATGYNTRTPENDNYNSNYLDKLPLNILDEEGKLNRDLMLKGEAVTTEINIPIDEEVCYEVNITKYIFDPETRYYIQFISLEEVCNQEPIKINCSLKEVCEYEIVIENNDIDGIDLYDKVCYEEEVCDILTEKKVSKELSLDYLSFNNRLLINELKEENVKRNSEIIEIEVELCNLGVRKYC